MRFVGLTGEIAPVSLLAISFLPWMFRVSHGFQNGSIYRLGLLQAPRQHSDPPIDTSLLSYTPAQTLLWTQSASKAPKYRWAPTGSIWSHRRYKVDLFPSRDEGNLIPADMMPHSPFIWADFPHAYEHLKRISALQLPSGSVDGNSEPITSTLDITALQYTRDQPVTTEPQHVGNAMPARAMRPDWNECLDPKSNADALDLTVFNQAHTHAFDIDGAGGETVTEVHFSPASGALKLVTNRGRESAFNHGEQSDWVVKTTPPGHVIVGLSCCFGKLSGWSQAASLFSHWKLSDLGVITIEVKEGLEDLY